MSEIASLRKRLEPYAIELAIPRLTGTSRIKVTRALEDMAFGADNNDLTATVDAHMAFHRAFYELSEHKLLLDLWKSWEAQLQMFFSADHQAFADLHDMVADHERLLSIIDRGDIDEITREIAVHVHSPSPRRGRGRSDRVSGYVNTSTSWVGDPPTMPSTPQRRSVMALTLPGCGLSTVRQDFGASLQFANLSRLAES